MESFMESLNRLKDVHEKEVLGLQSKLLELNSEKCRDAQRIEELFAKNQQLREQQKALKENVRVLENRLRAGLCDRCMVTQELARKKQHEFENSHLQSLQHIFLLTNEVNGLKEENRSLREEVKRLRGLEDRPRPLSKGCISDPPSPLLLPSPGGPKASPEKLSGGHEEAEDEPPSTEKSSGLHTSPVAKISPGATLPDPRALDMSPQHIANQLHGTIAVLRPGARAGPADRGVTDGTPPPAARSSPPSPPYEHSLPLHSFLRASRPSAVTYEALRCSLQADPLCLLNRHLALHLHSPRSAAAAPPSPRAQGLTAGEADAWGGPAGLLDLVDVRDPRLESALHLLLAQQRRRVQGGRARPGGLRTPGQMPPSPPAEHPESGADGAALNAAALPGEQRPRPPALASPRDLAASPGVQDYGPDKPLDLSDHSRSRDIPKPARRPGSLSPPTAHAGSPGPPQDAGALAQSRPLSSPGLSNSTTTARAAEPEQTPTPADPLPASPGHVPNLPSPGGMGNEARGRPKLAAHPQWPDADGHPEPSKAGMQRAESDELEEPDYSDGEVAPSSEVGSTPSAPGAGPRCFCTQEHGQGLQQKRKRASEPWGKASKKAARGRRRLQEALAAAEGPQSPRGAEDGSPSPRDGGWQQT